MTTITNSGTNDGVLVGINNGTVKTEIHLPRKFRESKAKSD